MNLDLCESQILAVEYAQRDVVMIRKTCFVLERGLIVGAYGVTGNSTKSHSFHANRDDEVLSSLLSESGIGLIKRRHIIQYQDIFCRLKNQQKCSGKISFNRRLVQNSVPQTPWACAYWCVKKKNPSEKRIKQRASDGFQIGDLHQDPNSLTMLRSKDLPYKFAQDARSKIVALFSSIKEELKTNSTTFCLCVANVFFIYIPNKSGQFT